MKKLLTLLMLCTTLFSFAQVPEKISYQVVVKTVNNKIVANAQVGVRISILQTTTAGTTVYIETKNTLTNAKGFVTIEVGEGTVVSGDLTKLDWSADKYFIKTEIDPKGGNDYSIISPVQLLSLPHLIRKKTKANAKYIVNTFYPELGGYVIEGSSDGKHGVVVAMQDQGVSNWYKVSDLLSNTANFDENGSKFRDWRLPTKQELNLIYLSKSSIGNFTKNAYWSSTEIYKTYAWIQFFYFGNRAIYYKPFTNFVRAVRTF
jgi:hypothetical protein